LCYKIPGIYEKNNNNNMQLTKSQQLILNELNVKDPSIGLTTDEVSARRGRNITSKSSNNNNINNEDDDDSNGVYYNVVKPPIDCPSWVCCLLPCIHHIPSMKIYQQICPEDAEVLRNGNWIRYDSTSLVVGDIIRIEPGDIVPADCIILQIMTNEILVDMKYISGCDKPISITLPIFDNDNGTQQYNNNLRRLYWGSRIVQGSAITVCTAIGSQTHVAKLIQQRKFPPLPTTISSSLSRLDLSDDDDDVNHTSNVNDLISEQGISLIHSANRSTDSSNIV
jgi:E1-E2 ATPase